MQEKLLSPKKKRTKKKKREEPRSFWQDLFTPRTWLTSYCRWVVIIFIILVAYRDTTDGLIFFFFMAYGIAKSLEGYIKDGTPFIRGKRRNQTIRQYGYIRTLLSVISPFDLWRKKRNLVEEAAYIFFGGLVFMVFLNHCYLLGVLLFDYLFPQTSAALFTTIEDWFWPVLSHWQGFMHNRMFYINHGYGDKVYLVAQTFLCAHIGAIFFALYLLYIFITRRDMVKSVHAFMQNNDRIAREGGRNFDLFERVLAFLFFNRYCIVFTWFTISAGIICLFYFMGLILYFPGEPHIRGGKYTFLYCYAYNNHIGYLSYSYMVYFMYLAAFATFAGGISCLVDNYQRIKNF